MSPVRLAHMPGNYEMYDPSENRLGPAVCKLCWERLEKRNSGPLNTVWVSFKQRRMIWWLCEGCTREVSSDGYQETTFLKSAQGVISSPGLDV